MKPQPKKGDLLRFAITHGDHNLGKQIFASNYWEYRLMLRQRKLIVEPKNKRVLNELWLHFSGLAECEFPFYIAGDQGRGKSVLFLALVSWCFDFTNTTYKIVDYETALESYLYDKTSLHKLFGHRNLIIDDFAKDLEKENVRFGNKVTLAEKIINYRYNLWLTKNYQTHYVSNWTTKVLSQHYQERSINRLLEMCKERYYLGDRDYRLKK